MVTYKLYKFNKEFSYDAPVLSKNGEVLSSDDELKLNEPVITNNTEVELIISTNQYKR